MNKTAIKNFAVWARNKLIADISYKAGLLGITEKGIASALPQSTGTTEFYDIGTAEPYVINGDQIRQRSRLVELIEQKAKESDYKTAYNYIIEEVAYTWFNRLIAIRFMEVNDYLPSHIRVLSSESGKVEPDLVTAPFDSDLVFSEDEKSLILKLKHNNDLDTLFRLLFIKQCNKLNENLPYLFEETYDYTELLLNINITDKEGVVYRLINDISEADFSVDSGGQIEIIGWLYQFYNIEPKDNVFAKKSKLTKEEVPAATQLFTPEWIVRYMVENSLGRLWVSGHSESKLNDNWKYYLEDAEQNEDVQKHLNDIYISYKELKPEEIKVIDPCMGSGHILVYCFDILMQIYESQGYTQRDAAQSILKNNIYGLDIDSRASQLAYFAVMMKAREYDRRILTRSIKPHINVIEESNSIVKSHLKYFGDTLNPLDLNNAKNQLNDLIEILKDAKEYGSILNVGTYDWDLLYRFVDSMSVDGQITMETIGIENTQQLLRNLIEIGKVISDKYHIVITNPPYMAVSGGSAKLNKYVKDNYPDSKTDMFAVFIEKCRNMTKVNGYQAMITMHAWMFLSSYEKLRNKLNCVDTVNMIHLGARAFEEIGGEVVQTSSFIIRNSNISNYKGIYCRLIEPNSQQGKEDMFLKGENRFVASNNGFSRIQGCPIAYWVSEAKLANFSKTMQTCLNCKTGLICGNNEKYIRKWYEVDALKIYHNANSLKETSEYEEYKWFPYNHGGDKRKWYGGHLEVVNLQNDAQRMRQEKNAMLRNSDYYFKEGITWNRVGSGMKFAARIAEHGFAFDDVSPSGFLYQDNYLNVLAYMNTVVFNDYLKIFATALKTEIGHIQKVPYIDINDESISVLAKKCCEIAKKEWDSYELSWNFERHPLCPDLNDKDKEYLLTQLYEKWKARSEQRFATMKENEETLNGLFIKHYGLNQELDSSIQEKDITLRVADLEKDVRSLLSYIVGCIFGRYSIDVPAVVYAGGNWDATKYKTFIPDVDNCIPISDEEYFEDDLVGLVCAWIKKIYGSRTLEENLDFIASALGVKGTSSREIIRNYFLTDFIKDHNKMYQKCPIYWMFDSGKKNGFKALIYMHRWDEDTIGRVRVDYLHKAQRTFESEINRMQDMIDHSTNNREVSTAIKRREKLQKQLKECQEYDEKIGHLALSRIDIDLDDGVKVNYEKVQTASDGKKYQVLAKI